MHRAQRALPAFLASSMLLGSCVLTWVPAREWRHRPSGQRARHTAEVGGHKAKGCQYGIARCAQDPMCIPGGDGLPPEILRTLPAGLPEGALVPAVRPLPDGVPFYEVSIDGQLSPDMTFAKDLWQHRGALIVGVRRPGCMMCREQAASLSNAFEQARTSGLTSSPRLIALVRQSHVVDGEDGTNEIEAFREFFPGEIFVDPDLSIFKAFGDRSYTEGALTKESALWMLQRMYASKGRTISGNFVGGPDISLKFGGCMVVDRSGKILWSHQEGVGSINYESMKASLMQI